MTVRQRVEWMLERFNWYHWDTNIKSERIRGIEQLEFLLRLLRELPLDEQERMLDPYRTSIPRRLWVKFEEERKWRR